MDQQDEKIKPEILEQVCLMLPSLMSGFFSDGPRSEKYIFKPTHPKTAESHLITLTKLSIETAVREEVEWDGLLAKVTSGLRFYHGFSLNRKKAVERKYSGRCNLYVWKTSGPVCVHYLDS